MIIIVYDLLDFSGGHPQTMYIYICIYIYVYIYIYVILYYIYIIHRYSQCSRVITIPPTVGKVNGRDNATASAETNGKGTIVWL